MRTIKGVRIDLGLSQKQMAEELGISEVAYRNKEAYRTELTATQLVKLLNLANIDVHDIKVSLDR